MPESLDNAPPRLSDKRGDELTAALKARHERHKANWQRTRAPGRVASIMERITALFERFSRRVGA